MSVNSKSKRYIENDNTSRCPIVPLVEHRFGGDIESFIYDCRAGPLFEFYARKVMNFDEKIDRHTISGLLDGVASVDAMGRRRERRITCASRLSQWVPHLTHLASIPSLTTLECTVRRKNYVLHPRLWI